MVDLFWVFISFRYAAILEPKFCFSWKFCFLDRHSSRSGLHGWRPQVVSALRWPDYSIFQMYGSSSQRRSCYLFFSWWDGCIQDGYRWITYLLRLHQVFASCATFEFFQIYLWVISSNVVFFFTGTSKTPGVENLRSTWSTWPWHEHGHEQYGQHGYGPRPGWMDVRSWHGLSDIIGSVHRLIFYWLSVW